MLIHHEVKSVASDSVGWDGSNNWIGNTANTLRGLLRQVYVKSDTSTTYFKFKLTDNQDRVIYDTNDYQEGTFNQTNVGIPIKGIYQMSIYGSHTEEAFKIMLGIQED